MAKEFDLKFFEASAKHYLNVEEIFASIVTDVKDRLLAEGTAGNAGTGFKLNQASNSTAAKSKGCC